MGYGGLLFGCLAFHGCMRACVLHGLDLLVGLST